MLAVSPLVTATAQGQFTYTNTDGGVYDYSTNADGASLTITGYEGPPWNIIIPASMNGLTVADIGKYAFLTNENIASVAIPASVANIGTNAFLVGDSLGGPCALTAISVDPANSFYSSVNGVLFDNSQSMLISYPANLDG